MEQQQEGGSVLGGRQEGDQVPAVQMAPHNQDGSSQKLLLTFPPPAECLMLSLEPHLD